ncbi:D-amino-acid oxidase [Coprinopsis marcescibilis]|uniref:D-amino-acid oxidase n=1 Tax=Coprinopsis marcescibilis TaxID=230819 RepID=A0A5C3L7N4_COPMA|nr:D-amino-acid oxidase [Coprinopsis marcescibilis]
MEKKSVIVLGAGVIGLTTALRLQEQGGYQVTIVAENLPTDPKTIKYTSLWAGAHHVSFATLEEFRHALDKQTFEEMWALSGPNGEAESCFMRLQQTEYFGQERSNPSTLAHMPEFRSLTKDEFAHIEGAKAGETFQTVTIDVGPFTNFLLSKFIAKGGRVVRGSVQHIDQLAENGVAPFLETEQRRHLANQPPKAPDAIIVCAGLAARSLGGVEDKDVYPIRGQVILVKAPWIKIGRTFSSTKDNLWTYVIPRRSGDVILGGTLEANDWYPKSRPETTRWILERTLKLMPELVPQHLRKGDEPTVDELYSLVIEEGSGFRPARKGGVRLEAGRTKVPGTDRTIPVVYNYGHAGSGYIASFGCAQRSLELLEDAFKSQ